MDATEWRDESKKWWQRNRDSYLCNYPAIRVSGRFAVMGQRDFDRLDVYSASYPTGVYLQKCWKSEFSDGWWLQWYDWPMEEGTVVGVDVAIQHKEIIVV